MIYIVCSTGEGVDYAVSIDAVFVNKARAISKCKKLNDKHGKWGVRGGHWVWGFQEGQSYINAKDIYPTHKDFDDAPPACFSCRQYLEGETVTLICNDKLNKDFTFVVHAGKCADKELNEPGVTIAPPGWKAPPKRPKNSCHCAAAMRWDTADGGHWRHVDDTITDHEAAPPTPTPEPPQLPPGTVKTNGDAFRRMYQEAKAKGLPIEVRAGNGGWKKVVDVELPEGRDA